MTRESLVVLVLSAWAVNSPMQIAPQRMQPSTVDMARPSAPQLLFTQFAPGPLASFKAIRNVMGRCLDIPGGINANRNRVQIFDCNGTKSQQWAFRDLRLQNVMGRCLEVGDGVNTSRTDVYIFDCSARKSQQWVFFKSGPYLGIRSALGLCLDVTGGINENRTGVQVFDCNGTAAQQWRRTGQSRPPSPAASAE